MIKIALRLLWISFGASVALGLALIFTKSPVTPFILASLGGSTIFLFGLTGAAAAQPRALFGGHLISALIGIAAFQCFGDALWVYVFAEITAICTLLITRTVHPPAGANPIIMIQSQANFIHLFQIVLIGVGVLALIACIWTWLTPGKVLRYPVKWNSPSPDSKNWSIWHNFN